jgi:hyperosmotically inducible protein
MIKNSRIFLSASAAIILTCFLSRFPADGQAPDTSRQNKGQSPNADDPAYAKTDRLTIAKIRKAIVEDKNLSSYAHKVKIIITRSGQLILLGPVKSEEEKRQVLTDAKSVVSGQNISNELTVKR